MDSMPNLWRERARRGVLPLTDKNRHTHPDIIKKVVPLVEDHLNGLIEMFEKYFTNLDVEKYDWIRDPFSESINVAATELSTEQQDELAELRCDKTSKSLALAIVS